MSLSRVLQNLDQFRVVSRDLTRGTASGGVFTAAAYALIVILLIAEFGAYMRTTYSTDVMMDENRDPFMNVNFDITLFDLPCKYLKIQVFDKFGEERLNSTNAFNYYPVDHKGSYKGTAYTEDEIAELEKVDVTHDVSDDEKKELDSDWSASSDHFKHNNFDAVVAFHDFTLVNFYAEWCVHCRQFHPTWMQAHSQISEKMKFPDGDGKLTTANMLKMNCVDFADTCAKAQIAAFPTIRLYKRDGKFEKFSGHRAVDQIIDFLKTSIKNSHKIVAKHHSMFSEGCQVVGELSVARVPGHFQIMAEPHGAVEINPALTNVSHRVNHLSFGAKHMRHWAERAKVPKDMVAHINPLDGKSFVVERFHEAPQHYLKVVSTTIAKGPVFYQMTHTDRTRRLRSKEGNQAVPQARFTYDFSPMSVVLKAKSKRWYEFVTSLFAIVGGTYTIAELACSTGVSVASTMKEALGKAS